jgi:MOSC domain-containing protein YiiM
VPEIVQLLVSPVHRYAGRPADGPLPEPPGELVEAIELRAGLGIVGDRYFGRRAHRDAAVTLSAAEHLPPGADLRGTRRNILLRGVDVDALVGQLLILDSGSGPVQLALRRPANPCAWLDVTIAPDTRAALRGRGGVRCSPLTDGVLRVGPISVRVSTPERRPEQGAREQARP